MNLCKAAFSEMMIIKSKYESTLENIEVTLSTAVSNIHPSFNFLYLKNTVHSSY